MRLSQTILTVFVCSTRWDLLLNNFSVPVKGKRLNNFSLYTKNKVFDGRVCTPTILPAIAAAFKDWRDDISNPELKLSKQPIGRRNNIQRNQSEPKVNTCKSVEARESAGN